MLLYYFINKSDVEIAEELGIPRSTVQYRRTSSFEQLKRYLEERADEWALQMKEKGYSFKTINNHKRSLKAAFYTAIQTIVFGKTRLTSS